MNKKLLIDSLQKTALLILSAITFIFQSCSSDDDNKNKVGEHTSRIVKHEEIREIAQNDLSSMSSSLNFLNSNRSTAEDNSVRSVDSWGVSVKPTAVKAIKVSTETNHPDGSGKKIRISGVLLVPNTNSEDLRIVVAPVNGYTTHTHTPSYLFDKLSLHWGEDFSHVYFWSLKSNQGYAVFLPDYLGFGDSYNECFHPYLVRKPLTNSTIDLIKAVQYVLTEREYKYKSEIILTGYSLGAYVATSVAKELEMNPGHGLGVKLLVIGETPANLKIMADKLRTSERPISPHFFIRALWSYKNNGYPDLNMNDILKEPYASESIKYFDGSANHINIYFPQKPSDLFSENFIKNLDTDPNLAYINQILKDNSLEPWKNKCQMEMIHDRYNYFAHYESAKQFADEQSKLGGNFNFTETSNYISASIVYYLKTWSLIKNNQ